MRLASALSSEPSAFVCCDQRLLLGDGGVGLLEPLHDFELAVFEVALAARERGELALEPLRLLRVAARGEPLAVACAARIHDRDIRLDARELGPQVVADAESRGQLLREVLAAGLQVLHARRLRRVATRVVRLADAGVELGDLDEKELVCGAGVHESNLPGP